MLSILNKVCTEYQICYVQYISWKVKYVNLYNKWYIKLYSCTKHLINYV